MSPLRISRSEDLQRLRDDGYQIEIKAGHLLVGHVPYVNSRKEVKLGTLVTKLTLAGDVTVAPDDHTALFAGEPPCDLTGSQLKFINGTSTTDLGGVVVNVSFSAKPAEPYPNYYEKVTTYVALISSPAAALDSSVTARTGLAIPTEGDDETVFNYIDNASSRSGIGTVSAKLARHKIGIVGLGGTGSYILDLVSKTPVSEIHLFDGDEFLQHNAFRAPGAASIDELRARPKKVAYFASIYSRMHKAVIPHPYHISAENAQEVGSMDFVFICMDMGKVKKAIAEVLEKAGKSFVDVGMGVEHLDEEARLLGILRVTASTPTRREHFSKQVALSDDDGDNEYDKNIQIADLNCLNATLAVVKWKKLCGFYDDQEREHSSTYTINCNMLLSGENTRADEAAQAHVR